MVVKFSTLMGGVFIEIRGDGYLYEPGNRCFRFDEKGNSEYTFYRELAGKGPHPRWYAHQYKEKDFTFA